jgi:hypothetical protein
MKYLNPKTLQKVIICLILTLPLISRAQQRIAFINGGGAPINRTPNIVLEVVGFTSGTRLTVPIRFKVSVTKGVGVVTPSDTEYVIDSSMQSTEFVEINLIVNDVSAQSTDSVEIQLVDIRGATANSGADVTTFILLPAKPTALADNSTNINQLIVYPNPTMHNIKIHSTDEITGLQIMDVNGEIVYNNNTSMHDYEIDIQAMPAGMYFVWVATDKAITRRIIIKQ